MPSRQSTDDLVDGGQWFAGICFASLYSPLTWIGNHYEVHVHVWAAILIGGALSGFAILWIRIHPTADHTRHVVAAVQMLWSALLIHLSGGRIETHFHVFGSLAILSIYRDWKILITATVVVAADHFIRGVFYPLSAFGIVTESPYRWIEHALWVVFEVSFLVPGCRRLLNEFRELCMRQSEIEEAKRTVDVKVEERTRDLVEANRLLAQKTAEAETLKQEMLDASRQAGMAEVATGVLHNVGNILNSVNVSASLIQKQYAKSALKNLEKATGLIDQYESTFAEFVANDNRGKKLPQYLVTVSKALKEEQQSVETEFADLTRNIEHIKEIIAVQQTMAKSSGLHQELHASEIIRDVLTANKESLCNHKIEVDVQLADPDPFLVADKHRILQILINLVRNAKDAMLEAKIVEPRVSLRTWTESDCVCFEVGDNGVGIAPEKISKIFQHGFTTKRHGHGFGLHSSANAATEIGGQLSAASEGLGRGARFLLRVPTRPATQSNKNNASRSDAKNSIPQPVSE